MPMIKSQSVPGLLKLGTTAPLPGARYDKKATLSFRLDSAVDLKQEPVIHDDAKRVAEMLRTPAWRLLATERPETPPAPEDSLPRNMVHPRVAPAWLKHDKQVLRFYAYFQESVCERSDENSRYRNVTIAYHMEDGTMRMSEPRVENSGIPQGTFLKRHQVPRSDGLGFMGPDDFRCGQNVTIYGRTYHITGCDRFTRWFYEQNGIDVGEDEPLVQDLWQKSYRFRKTAEKGGLPLPKCAAEAKTMMKFQAGAPPAAKIQQFLLNDRKVLRFKGYWDDPTPYGARIYLVVHFYLSDNTVEINEANCRNSGRDGWPVFMKRGPLFKKNEIAVVPGQMVPDVPPYLPEDLMVGQMIDVWRRKVVLYDCDDFTRSFYQEYMGIDQHDGKIDVAERPIKHKKLHPPPHNGIGNPEDSITNCQMIQPKPPKIDLVRLMKMSGENLRFEAEMANGEPEDETRRMVISLFPETNPITISVFELQNRNSGHVGGKFAERKRMVNPDTGKYFEMTDFFVGQTVNICAQPLHIIRADEHALQFMETHSESFPWANVQACAQRVAPLAGEPELRDESGIDPDRLKELAAQQGVYLVDHEVITLLRRFPVDVNGPPRIYGPKVLEAVIG